MSEENVEIVRVAIDAFNRRDWDAALEDAAPSFEFDNSRSIGPLRGVYGLDQVRRFWEDTAEMWEVVRIEPAEFIESGEHVIVPHKTRLLGRDGIEVQTRTTWHVFTLRDGDIARLCLYEDAREAREAAGLRDG